MVLQNEQRSIGKYLNSAPPFSCIVVYIGINNLLKTEAKKKKKIALSFLQY